MNKINLESLNTRKLKVGFLGGGFESAVGRAHRAAIEMDQRFELVSGCFSRKPEVSKSTALKYCIDLDRSYSDIDHFLSSEASQLDAVVIMTPQDQHSKHVMRCLEADLPVICEKALVGSVEEALLIQRKLLSSQGFLAVTYNYTGFPILRELRYMIKHGKLGKIQQVQIEMPQEGFARLGANGQPITPQDWRLQDNKVPTLSLDLGVHIHMMIRFLTGEQPLEVVSTSKSYGNFNQVTDSISCISNYSNDISCSIWYSKSALGYRNGLKVRIFGSKGSAEWVQEDSEHLNISDNSGNRLLVDRASNNISVANHLRYTRFKAGHPAGFIEAFANYYYDVADALKYYLLKKNSVAQEYVFGIEESLEGLRMLEAISKSSSNKRWEEIV
ncbi:Gfo/Idh/MocA family protein [Pseudomonas sp. Fl4BN1]|uniref:Gfo/Idh/MocA family protein n=1 Tax=Pseudomonas sp. Fl4BN1 TaxID=2697651 RepID=UPI0015B4C73F|nr:Gfo/Idh/MocA family oxidoreductase [Pseudomonas sp. Fl4BN1]